ncbi:WD repeat-containing and planar cell polarity effector protein fritz homolog isoform X2 [Erpetoichthys calabaricus]|uniref:WD repeat-containing and planar cell polarity effector protein fritz homolog isoform X2 n=1 Tax=Erpetoichthys calabaricus TaxID=27687 RepID=UPI00223493C4|nr:WD repeat-containing and planar cell polarity effector protein fritz homolog isoform X2 [Erpetoichthys calabaricus]
MSFLLAELHLWSLKKALHVQDTDIGTYQYYDKGEPAREYAWTLKNKRPEKVRDNLKELEDLLQNSSIVWSKWKNKNFCQLFLGSGVLVSLSLSGPQLGKVTIDRTLVGRLITDTISDVVLADTFMILTFLEKNKVCYVQFTKKQSSPDLSRRLEKLSISELKVSYVDLPGPSGRRVDRHLALNCLQDMAICWWPTINDSAWPWSPISSERDRANLVLLGCTNDSFQILHCIHTEWDPLDAGFSISQPYQLFTVEHSINADKEKMADSCIYDCSRNKVHRITVTSIPLKSRAICCSLDCTEEKLILGCQDSSLVLYDSHRQVTLLAQADLLPTLIEWHPSGAMFVVGSSQGELQCFDVAIAPLKIQVLAEDLNPKVTIQFNKHFNVSTSLTQIQWAVGQGPSQSGTLNIHDLLFLRFDKGPLGMLCFKLGAMTTGQLGHTELVHQCIRYGQIDEAVNILSAINWNTMGPDCYICLSAIFDHLLRQNLTAEREAQIEAVLGTFYTPARPLTETTVLEYRDAICKYARRFFHHLLRYQRFEKAFLLAIDIGARDLYMDIHYLALDKGELVLAEVAKKKANEIDAESITTGVEAHIAFDAEDLHGDLPEPLAACHTDSCHPPGSSHLSDDTPAQRKPSFRPPSRRLTAETASELGSDAYTAALMHDPWSWTQAGNDLADNIEQETEEMGSLKVIHFGLV